MKKREPKQDTRRDAEPVIVKCGRCGNEALAGLFPGKELCAECSEELYAQYEAEAEIANDPVDWDW